MYTSMGTAVDTWPYISGAWIFSTFFRHGVYLNMNISRIKTGSFSCQSCLDTLGGWGILTACSSWRAVEWATVGLHDPWILFLWSRFLCFRALSPKNQSAENILSEQLSTGNILLTRNNLFTKGEADSHSTWIISRLSIAYY